MYESPINLIEIERQLIAELEGNTYKVIKRMGIDVDRDELIKALQYDRDQYDKGYRDGKAEEAEWTPCDEGLPNDLEPVNITWVNHNPESYNADIKDKPFTATGLYFRGKWYWYSSTCQDYLEEYGRCDVDEIDKDIEVIAWMPLPEPYKAEREDEE